MLHNPHPPPAPELGLHLAHSTAGRRVLHEAGHLASALLWVGQSLAARLPAHVREDRALLTREASRCRPWTRP